MQRGSHYLGPGHGGKTGGLKARGYTPILVVKILEPAGNQQSENAAVYLEDLVLPDPPDTLEMGL